MKQRHHRAVLRASLPLWLAWTLVGCASSSNPKPQIPNPNPLSASPVESTELWEFNGRSGKVVRTPHFRIYTTQTEPILLNRLPIFLESALTHYRTALSSPDTSAPLPVPPLKLDTFIMRSRPEWERLTKQMLGDQSAPFLRIQRGGFAWGGRALLFDIGKADTMSIAAHEGWHQYSQRTFAQPLPIWLEEGLGTYMEGHRWLGATPTFYGWANVERFDALRRAAAQGRLCTLGQLLDSTPGGLLGASGQSEDVLTYYAQVWALSHFLAEGESGRYAPALAGLLADAVAGRIDRRVATAAGIDSARSAMLLRRGPVVFTVYFNADLAAAEREYAAFIDRIVQPGSRGPIVAGESPLRITPGSPR